MRFLVGLVAVVAIAIGYVALGYAEEHAKKRCTRCGLDTVTVYKTSIGGPTLLSCTQCGAHYRETADGSGLIPD